MRWLPDLSWVSWLQLAAVTVYLVCAVQWVVLIRRLRRQESMRELLEGSRADSIFTAKCDECGCAIVTKVAVLWRCDCKRVHQVGAVDRQDLWVAMGSIDELLVDKGGSAGDAT